VELDALLIEGKTNLPYASKVHAKDANGLDTFVMHTCEHDVHMAAWMGRRASWRARASVGAARWC
jgi:metal-dependent amidase/aminoacylase/carboxypeptidase family protein